MCLLVGWWLFSWHPTMFCVLFLALHLQGFHASPNLEGFPRQSSMHPPYFDHGELVGEESMSKCNMAGEKTLQNLCTVAKLHLFIKCKPRIWLGGLGSSFWRGVCGKQSWMAGCSNPCTEVSWVGCWWCSSYCGCTTVCVLC